MKGAALAALAVLALACSTGSGALKPTGSGGNGSGTTGSGASNSGPAGTGAAGNTSGGLGGAFVIAGSGSGGGRASRCDDAGNCSCINIASIGHEGVWGPCSSDSTTALQNWLNTQSTAKVDNYDTTKPTLTPAFLAQYDVLILQWMVTVGMQNNDGAAWVFAPDEISALQDWVNKGGGLVALSGYQCNGSGCPIVDITASNQLLSFTDIQFNADDVADPQKTSCQDCYCWGGSLPLGGPIPDAGSTFVGTWDQTSPVGTHINSVGAYTARSIKSTSASVDCTDGTYSYSVHEQIGKGHVVAYGDEWVTYSGQWLGTAACLNPSMFTNVYDPCYEKSAAQVFQIPQFWYNVIKYAASSVSCFMVNNPGIIQ